MAPLCEPLCRFTDRLYYTTFPVPAPLPHALNSLPVEKRETPQIRYSTQAKAKAKETNANGTDENAKYYYFTIDNQLTYWSFFEDWGPLNIAMVYKACILIHELLEDPELKDHRLVLYSSSDPRRKANAALLLALYVMIVHHLPPWEAFHPLASLEFLPFRDAGRSPPDFHLSIQDCLWGVYKALQNGLLDMNEFNVEEYEFYEKVENGDWNWITPGFIAFASPVEAGWVKRNAAGVGANTNESTSTNNTQSQSPLQSTSSNSQPSQSSQSQNSALRRLPPPFSNLLTYFQTHNVQLVIRLNNCLYDRSHFTDLGIRHEEMFFEDGTNPTDEIVRRFIEMVDGIVESGGVVGVHCKAGLGRTGTLIGAYLTWKYGFTAHEAIAFMRIVRPGTVVGPQQQYMYVKQMEWVRWAAAEEVRKGQEQMQLQLQQQQGLVKVNGGKKRKVKEAKVKTKEERVVGAPVTPPAEVDEDEEGEVEDGDVEMGTSDVPLSIMPRPSTPVVLVPSMPGVGSPVHSPVRQVNQNTIPIGVMPLPLPPMTPSRHVAAATEKAGMIAPPGQPRKTPRAKRFSGGAMGTKRSAAVLDEEDEAADVFGGKMVGDVKKDSEEDELSLGERRDIGSGLDGEKMDVDGEDEDEEVERSLGGSGEEEDEDDEINALPALNLNPTLHIGSKANVNGAPPKSTRSAAKTATATISTPGRTGAKASTSNAKTNGTRPVRPIRHPASEQRPRPMTSMGVNIGGNVRTTRSAASGLSGVNALNGVDGVLRKPPMFAGSGVGGNGANANTKPLTRSAAHSISRSSEMAGDKTASTTTSPSTGMRGRLRGTGPPNKIPRLNYQHQNQQDGTGVQTRSNTALGTRTRAQTNIVGSVSPSNTNNNSGSGRSRLPTLTPSTRGNTTSNVSSNLPKGAKNAKGVIMQSDAWMKDKNTTSVVVKPGSKSERPGLRSVRRRRSSFSAADESVVA